MKRDQIIQEMADVGEELDRIRSTLTLMRSAFHATNKDFEEKEHRFMALIHEFNEANDALSGDKRQP